MSVTMLERLEERLMPEPMSGCWLWTGGLDRDGYAKINLYPDGVQAGHRLAYETVRGSIPAGLEIDHLCRVKCCVNPAHMELVTRTENLRRAGQAKTHCRNGHLFTESNTYRTKKDGWRGCRVCRSAARVRHERTRVRYRKEEAA